MGKRIIIIGGGPAGYEAALHGAHLGGNVTLIEDHKIGGSCLNYGCIPTKTLIEHANFYDKLVHNKHLGVRVNEAILDYDQVLRHKDSVIESLSSGIMSKLKKAKVTYISGYGRIVDGSKVEVKRPDGSITLVKGDVIVLATGSKPFVPQFPGGDSQHLLTSKDLLSLEKLPTTITIVGGGVIGMEFAVLLNAFGVQVTVLEYAKNLLPLIDSAISKRLKSIISKKGITVYTGAKVTGFEDVGHRLKVIYEDKTGVHELISDKALMSIGRVGRYDLDNMDEQGIQHNERFVQVDDQLMTSLQGIYAIGDVNGQSLLAHAAYDQGRQVMECIILERPVQKRLVPACVFTNPEIATVGLSEDEAKVQAIAYTCQRTLYSTSGKALAMDASTGFIKTLVSEKGLIIGFHVFGEHASDLVHYGSIAMEGKMTVEQLKNIIFAHPTLGELFSDNMRQYGSI